MKDDDEIKSVGFVANGSRFLFVYRASQRIEVSRRVAKFAADPRVPLDWGTAARVLSEINERG